MKPNSMTMRMNRDVYANRSGPESCQRSPPSRELTGSVGSCLLEPRVRNDPRHYKFPVLISKSLKKSHVSRGFWLGLPAWFCDNYLGSITSEMKMVLEDEDGKLWDTKYLPTGKGLSGGWRRFALDHNLEVGNTVHFRFISTNKCKVYIAKGKDSKIDDPVDVDRDDSWQGNTTRTVTSIQPHLKEGQRDGEVESTYHKKLKTTQLQQLNSERISLGERQQPSNIYALRREESYGYEDSFGGDQECHERLQRLIEKKRSILRNCTGGQRSSREENDNSGMIDMRHPMNYRVKEEAIDAQKRGQNQESTQRCLKGEEPSKTMRLTFDICLNDEQSSDEDKLQDDDRYCLRPTDRHNPAAASAEGVNSQEIDDGSCKIVDGKKVKLEKPEGSNPWSTADEHDPHITTGRDEIFQYNEICKAAAAPQEGSEETLNEKNNIPSSKQEAAHGNIHSEDSDDGAKGEGDDSTLPVSADEFARDIRLLRTWFKRQVVQVAEDLKTTMTSSCESQQRDTRKRIQFQSNQQREFFDHLVQRQHVILNRIFDQKIETQIQQLKHRFDQRLQDMIEELKGFIQVSLNAGRDKRHKYY